MKFKAWERYSLLEHGEVKLKEYPRDEISTTSRFDDVKRRFEIYLLGEHKETRVGTHFSLGLLQIRCDVTTHNAKASIDFISIERSRRRIDIYYVNDLFYLHEKI